MKNEKIYLPKFDNNPNRDLYSELKIDPLPNFVPIDLKESTGIDELISTLVSNHNDSITLQNETINQLIKVVESQQQMISDANKDSKETRLYSIISIVLAIIAILISIVLG